MAEKMAEKIAAYGIPVTSSLSTSQLPSLIPSNPSLTPLTTFTTLPHNVVVTAPTHPHMATPGLIRVAETTNGAAPPPILYGSLPQTMAPEPKRVCLEQNSTTTHQPSSPSSTTHPSVLVKVRVCGSGECDFVEVEVKPVTYLALLAACCEELELASSDVAKIRKLPNVLIRKDKDVQRMRDGQELEVVLKSEVGSVVSPPASYPTTSMLTVNPFAGSNATVLTLSNHGVVQQRGDGLIMKPDENGTANHIPGMASDSSDVQSHTHSSSVVNGLQ
jgi:hypothetical protein